MIEIQTTLNAKDAFRLRMVYYKNTFLNYTYAVLFLMGIIVGIHTLHTRNFEFYNLVLLFAGIFLPVFTLMVAYGASLKTIRETFVFKHPISFRITPEYLDVEGYQTATKIEWSNAFNYAEDNYAFYVYISSMQAYILPKRDIKPAEIPEVRQLISDHVKKKKYTVKRVIAIFAAIIFVLVSVTKICTW